MVEWETIVTDSFFYIVKSKIKPIQCLIQKAEISQLQNKAI